MKTYHFWIRLKFLIYFMLLENFTSSTSEKIHRIINLSNEFFFQIVAYCKLQGNKDLYAFKDNEEIDIRNIVFYFWLVDDEKRWKNRHIGNFMWSVVATRNTSLMYWNNYAFIWLNSILRGLALKFFITAAWNIKEQREFIFTIYTWFFTVI